MRLCLRLHRDRTLTDGSCLYAEPPAPYNCGKSRRASLDGASTMHIIDSHFHWWPRSVSERFCKRTTLPRAHVNEKGGYTYLRDAKADYVLSSWTEWFDLDRQLEAMDKLGHQVAVVLSIGPFSVFFSELPPEEAREAAIHWNEEMAGAQKKYPGRVWASAAIPLVDTRIALDVLDDAVNRLGLMGVNMPGSIGPDQRIDAERLGIGRA